MEHISPEQLKKYESILSQIEAEHERRDQLRRTIAKANGRFVAARLARDKDFAKKHMFRVLVKVFDSPFDIVEVYGNELPKSELCLPKQHCNLKYYLVQVYMLKAFRQRRFDSKWFLNVCVKNTKSCVNRQVKMVNENSADPMLVVIPFDGSAEPSTVVTTLVLPLDNSSKEFLEVSTIDVDISYHFGSETHCNMEDNLMNTMKSFGSYESLPKLEYQFSCKCSDKHFFESLVRNCYHRLNSDTLAAFTEKNVSTLCFEIEIGGAQHHASITLNREENCLSLTASPEDLYYMKKYFINQIRCGATGVEKLWLVEASRFKHLARVALSGAGFEPRQFKVLYEQQRKLMFHLPI